MTGKVFNNVEVGDQPLTLDMRIHESTRRMLQQMFIQSEEAKEVFTEGLELAIRNTDIKQLVYLAAQETIKDVTKHYFAYGAGRDAIEKATREALDKVFAPLMVKEGEIKP